MKPSALVDVDPVHLIGVGGAGMSAIARVLIARGLRVSGSDMKESSGTRALRALGARITIGHDAANIAGARSVVVSSAIRDANPELRAAHAQGTPVLHRAQILALLMRERRGIAVSGTHGKTTTTSMLALVLQHAQYDASFLIGGDLNELGTNAHHGTGEWLVAEADESDGSFLWLSPEIAVITNVEAEHLDHYRDEEEVRETFRAFIGNVRPGGAVVACADDAGARALLDGAPVRVITYGLEQGEWRASRTPHPGGQVIEVSRAGNTLGSVRLGVPGAHNAHNALAALAAADLAGVAFATAAQGLALYGGVQRRFQMRGRVRGVTVVDDYAHNPTKVRAALDAAREQNPRRVIAVFQPHLYSRTAHFANALGAALSSADLVVVTDVYGAREEPQPGISGKLVVDAVLAASPRVPAAYIPRRAELADYVCGRVREGDLVLTIGAGDITVVGQEILARLEERR